MRKKRILFCSEATFLKTGYATYTREILNYLNSTNKYELAELGAYGDPQAPQATSIPWRYYGAALPSNASEEQKKAFQSQPTNQFGEYAFESVCLNFKPDIVCDIRDFWMLDFVERSPFRRFFKWCIMPTVDAAPQARQWIATYQSADACLSYSDWAGEVLKSQSGGKINYIGSAPPSAHPAYTPIQEKKELREFFNIDPEAKIVGTVMRNQRRKLYPDLFESFRKLIDISDKNDKYFLYCHTSYPDMGWDIPELLQQYNLSSKVLFTYVCPETQKPFSSFFVGAIAQSPFTGKFNSPMANVRHGISYEDLAKIINTFDIYVQHANCEGFGLPQVEAAACGVPVMGTDYSAMESVLRQLEGIPIKPKALYKEMETGCMRAVPDNDLCAEKLKEFFSMKKGKRKDKGYKTRQKFLEHFQWHISGKKWEEYFDSVEIVPDELGWYSPPDIKQPESLPENFPEKTSHQDVANWLLDKVLRQPEKINTYMAARLTRDLTYQCMTSVTGGMYQNESSALFEGSKPRAPFNIEIAYNQILNMRSKINYWEQQRVEALGIK